MTSANLPPVFQPNALQYPTLLQGVFSILFLCPGWESNPHEIKSHDILSVGCLPVSAPGQYYIFHINITYKTTIRELYQIQSFEYTSLVLFWTYTVTTAPIVALM